MITSALNNAELLEHEQQREMPMTTQEQVLRYSGERAEWAYDTLAREEPLQIRLAGEDVAVTMRTPGHDEELAAGFLFTEGIIGGKRHIEAINICPPEVGSPESNIVNIIPMDRALLDPRRWGRDFYATSSCGLCGKTSISQVRSRTGQVQGEWKVSPDTLYSLNAKLRAAQETFAVTGGLHAAALFDRRGNLLLAREDVGRHNAVDKVIGHALLHDWLPLDTHILLVSSRASFEVVQKALTAGVCVLAAVSAPSSLAVDLARSGHMTLVGFLRERRLNVYAGEKRVKQIE